MIVAARRSEDQLDVFQVRQEVGPWGMPVSHEAVEVQ